MSGTPEQLRLALATPAASAAGRPSGPADLSAVLLVGLAANPVLGWRWADPLAGLVIAGLAVAEGRQAWRGEGCCAPAGSTSAATAASATDGEAAVCCGPGCGCCR